MDQSVDLKFNLLTVGSKQGLRQFFKTHWRDVQQHKN
jgi:hypothetical protein